MRISLIVGLGNEDPRYAETYHNAGFLAADYLLGLKDDALAVPKDHILKTEGPMNGAGASVARAVRRLRIPAEELLVVHDDSDITLGAYTYSFNRNSAGHKGVESVIRALGTKAFWRLRIGTRPVGVRAKAAELVLAPIDAPSRDILSGVFARMAEELRESHRAPAPRS